MNHLNTALAFGVLMLSIPSAPASVVYDLPIRLANGRRPSQGTIQVFIDGQWGTVCATSFYAEEAQVVCRMLGFSGNVVWPAIKAYYGVVDGPNWIQGLDCLGNETSLMECSYSPLSSKLNCRYSPSAGIDCEPDTSEIPVRLSGSTSNRQGRVEIYHRGRWGTICGYGWGLEDATVVCKQLGFLGSTPVGISQYSGGPGGFPIFLGMMECNGDEEHLGLCSHRPWGNMDCYSKYVAGVQCISGEDSEASNPHHFEARLAGGHIPNKGRLEVKYLGHWRAMCKIQWFAQEDTTVCKMLGYQWGGEYKAEASIGYNLVSPVYCKRNEATLDDCVMNNPYLDNQCQPYDTVGLICRNDTAPTYPVLVQSPRVPILHQPYAVTCSVNGGSIDLTASLRAGRARWPWSHGSTGRQPSATIRFDRLGPEHNGMKFSCLTTNFDVRWLQHSEDFKLNVKFPPDRVTLQTSSPAEVGFDVTLTCMTSETNPAPMLIWFLARRQLTSLSDLYLRPGQSGGVWAFQNATVRITPEIIGHRVSCMVFHESSIFPKTVSIDLMISQYIVGWDAICLLRFLQYLTALLSRTSIRKLNQI